MSEHEGKRTGKHGLRRRAEAKVLQEGGDAAIADGNDSPKIIHELRVHQVELEMQNEELRRAQAEAETLREKYLELYEFAPAGYFTLDNQNMIRNVNLVGASLLGMERRSLLKNRFDFFIDAKSLAAFNDFTARILTTTAKQTCELLLTPRNTPPFHVHVEGISAHAFNGESELRLVLVDISERREMEKRIRLLNADLKRKTETLSTLNKDLEAFGWTISHELRSPLNNIYSAIQLMELDAGALSEDSKKMAGIIRQSCENMNRTIGSLYELSRSAWGTISRTETDLSQLAGETMEKLHQREPKRKAVFVIPLGLKATCDRELTRIVLDNLLENAWKFSSELDETRIEFGGYEEHGEKVFFVRDNGRGFSMEQAKSIFAPFQRASSIKEIAGSGIGLATVQTVVQRHGGRVWAEGGEDRGATIFFTLPDKENGIVENAFD